MGQSIILSVRRSGLWWKAVIYDAASSVARVPPYSVLQAVDGAPRQFETGYAALLASVYIHIVFCIEHYSAMCLYCQGICIYLYACEMLASIV